MKKCKHCGALQGNEHSNCIDCDARLGAPLTNAEEVEEERKVTEKMTKLSNKKDYFYVNRIDKTVAALLIIGAVLSLIFRISGGGNVGDAGRILLSFAIPLMAIEAIDLLFPWISWELYKIKFIFSVENADDLQPSDLMIYIRRIFPYSTVISGYVLLIYIIVKLLQ
jgi:hypothetical protein